MPVDEDSMHLIGYDINWSISRTSKPCKVTDKCIAVFKSGFMGLLKITH